MLSCFGLNHGRTPPLSADTEHRFVTLMLCNYCLFACRDVVSAVGPRLITEADAERYRVDLNRLPLSVMQMRRCVELCRQTRTKHHCSVGLWSHLSLLPVYLTLATFARLAVRGD